MKILSVSQTILKITGLLFTFSNNSWYIFYGYVNLFFCTILMYPCMETTLANIKNIAGLSQLMSIFAGAINAIIKVAFFIRKQDNFKTLLVDVQHIVDTSISKGRGNQYKKFNKIAERIASINTYCMICTLILLSTGPALTTTYNYTIKGNFTADDLILPAELNYPYDVKTPIAYPLTYLVDVISLYFMGMSHAGIDMAFIGFSLLLTACLKDLVDMFHDIDTFNERCRQSENCEYEIKTKFIRCINLHLKIFRLFKLLCDAYSSAIFFQFIFSFAQMCTLAFEMTMNDNRTFYLIISNIVMCSIVMTELLVYCYFGNEITYQFNYVSYGIYQTKWYQHDATTRYIIQTVIMRAQSRMPMTGLKFFNCSLENYTKVMNMVGSMLAILRSMVVK